MAYKNWCYFCGISDESVLEEHHIIPRSVGESPLTVTLCRNCHKKLHNLIKPLEILAKSEKPYPKNLEDLMLKEDLSVLPPKPKNASIKQKFSTSMDIWDNPNIINPVEMVHLSERQIRAIKVPTRWYAAEALKNGKWNLNWGDPRERVRGDFRIENLVYSVDKPQNKDFVIVMYKLGIWNYEKWGNPEDYGVTL